MEIYNIFLLFATVLFLKILIKLFEIAKNTLSKHYVKLFILNFVVDIRKIKYIIKIRISLKKYKFRLFQMLLRRMADDKAKRIDFKNNKFF